MSEPMIANATPTGQEAAPAANAAPAGSQATPPEETLYAINYKGQEEKLPLTKLIDFAQQGRDYSEKMGQLNAQIEARAKELTDAAIDQFYREQERLAIESKPAIDPNAPPAEIDEFTSLQKTVEELKAEREKEVFEKEVAIHVKELNSQIEKAVKDYPLANTRNILAVLRSQPNADVMKLAEYEHTQEKARREAYEKEFLAKAGERGKRGAEGAGGVAPVAAGKKIGWHSTQEAVMELLDKQN